MISIFGPNKLIDLHNHILPGIDDGAPGLEVSLAMARLAVADGIRVMACTPHATPGVYHNTREGILAAVAELQAHLDAEGIPLRLTFGADAHISPGLVEDLLFRRVPTLNDTRYFLLEPPHHVALPNFTEAVLRYLEVRYVPLITHPERLTWIPKHYSSLRRLVEAGTWVQVTAGSLTGQFGREARYWGTRMLDEGLVHVIASDAHSDKRRRPGLSEARAVAARYLGEAEADLLVSGRPAAVLEDAHPDEVPPVPYLIRAGAENRIERNYWRLRGAAMGVLGHVSYH